MVSATGRCLPEKQAEEALQAGEAGGAAGDCQALTDAYEETRCFYHKCEGSMRTVKKLSLAIAITPLLVRTQFDNMEMRCENEDVSCIYRSPRDPSPIDIKM